MINNNENNEIINQSNHQDNNEIKIIEQENNINKEINLSKSLKKAKIKIKIDENEEDRDIKRIRNKTVIDRKKLKIKRSFRKIMPKSVLKEEILEKHKKENKINEKDLEGIIDEGSYESIKKDGSILVDSEGKKILINKGQNTSRLRGKKKDGENDGENDEKNEGDKNEKDGQKNKKENNKKDGNNEEEEDEDDEDNKDGEINSKDKEERQRKKLIKLIRNKNTGMEKIREEIEKILKKNKDPKEKEEDKEKEKRRKRREEYVEKRRKEKERREKEANKYIDKARKKWENRNKSQNNGFNKDYKKNKFLNIKRSERTFDRQRNRRNNKFKNSPDNNLYNSKNLKLETNKDQMPSDQYIFESINDNQDNNNKSKFRTIFSEDQKTESYELKKRYILKRKNNVNVNIFSDPLNPYLTNWARSFLKIGYNEGIWANQAIGGVPILRLNRLKPKLEFPPIYKIKYNQFSKGNMFGSLEEKHFRNNYIDENYFKKINHEEKFDSMNSSSNNLFSSDRKLNFDKEIKVEEKNKTIDFSKHS